MNKPKILYLPTSGAHPQRFSPQKFSRAIVKEQFDVTLNETGSSYTSDQIAERVAGFEGIVTGWWVCHPITEKVMANADALRIIAHSAGSIKRLVGEVLDKYILPRQICVFSANEAIAYNVAEYTIGAMIMTHPPMG